MALQRLPRRSRRRSYSGPPRVLAYTRVSTAEQADSGAGLAAQRAAIEREAQARGWQDVEWITDAGMSAAPLEDAPRPVLTDALERLAAGEADLLCVSKLDRLSRSTVDFGRMVRKAHDEGWSLSILDLGLDMTTPQGKMMGNILSVFAEFERDLIAQRTRDGMAAKKASGQRFGAPLLYPASIRVRIAALRKKGRTYAAIADAFNQEGVPTAKGGKWYPMTVWQAVKAPEAS